MVVMTEQDRKFRSEIAMVLRKKGDNFREKLRLIARIEEVYNLLGTRILNRPYEKPIKQVAEDCVDHVLLTYGNFIRLHRMIETIPFVTPVHQS